MIWHVSDKLNLHLSLPLMGGVPSNQKCPPLLLKVWSPGQQHQETGEKCRIPDPHLSPIAPECAFDKSPRDLCVGCLGSAEVGNTFVYVLKTKMQQDAFLSKSI